MSSKNASAYQILGSGGVEIIQELLEGLRWQVAVKRYKANQRSVPKWMGTALSKNPTKAAKRHIKRFTLIAHHQFIPTIPSLLARRMWTNQQGIASAPAH